MKKSWQMKKIGDVCDLMTGGTPSKSKPEYFANGNIRWLVSGDIHQKEIFDCKGRITEEGMKNSNAKYLPVNSIIIALSGQGKTRGSVALLRTKATCNQSLVSISPKDVTVLQPEYIYFNLHGRYEEIRRITGDDEKDRRGLNMGLVKNIEIPIPPLPEQQRIVSVLDEAFASIAQAKANAEQNLVNARELFEAAQRELFEGIGNKKSEMKMLGDVATFRNGINFTKASKGETVKIVGVKDFQNYFWVPLDNLDSVTIDGKLNETDYLRKGDILAVRSNGNQQLIGRSILAGDVTEKTTHSGFTIRIRFESKDIFPEYLCHYLKSEKARKQLISGGAGISIKSLNQTTLSELPISLPSLAEQRAIVGRLEALSAETGRLEAIYHCKVEALEELKKSVLQRAFEGLL